MKKFIFIFIFIIMFISIMWFNSTLPNGPVLDHVIMIIFAILAEFGILCFLFIIGISCYNIYLVSIKNKDVNHNLILKTVSIICVVSLIVFLLKSTKSDIYRNFDWEKIGNLVCILLIIILSLLVLLVIYLLIKEMHYRYKFSKKGIEVHAVVINTNSEQIKQKLGGKLCIYGYYEDLQKQVNKFKEKIPISYIKNNVNFNNLIFLDLNKGDKIKIKYVPNTTLIRINGTRPSMTKLFVVFFGLLASTLSILPKILVLLLK